MAEYDAADSARVLAVIAPNASMSPAMARRCLLAVAVVVLGIATVWAWRGYWLILPFAGLEVLALAAAFYVALRDNRYREVILRDGDDIVVQTGLGRPQTEWRAPLNRAELRCEQPPGATARLRLYLRADGREQELGQCLGPREKQCLARRLQPLWRRAGGATTKM